jgi:precorrin-6B methylase 2
MASATVKKALQEKIALSLRVLMNAIIKENVWMVSAYVRKAGVDLTVQNVSALMSAHLMESATPLLINASVDMDILETIAR